MRKTEEKQIGNKNNSLSHTQISVRLPNELLLRIEEYAKTDNRSRNNAVEYLLWQSFGETVTHSTNGK